MPIESQLLMLFIPTFFMVSLTPGLCMTLALNLGMQLGYRKTLFMMMGELIGVTSVSLAAVLGVAQFALAHPTLFTGLKLIGALYLAYIGIKLLLAKQHQISINEQPNFSKNFTLTMQGFISAIANPKGWAFMIALLPPFINYQTQLAPQISLLVAIILLSEFSCMSLYALGGKSLAKLLANSTNQHRLNYISGSLMILLALFLVIT